MSIFDVALWSRGDIESKCKELKVPCDSDFIDLTIEILNHRFDASIGINWDTIETAILDNHQIIEEGKI